MTDLIRRDDAIRELSGACSNWEDDAKVQEIVMAIPSAELVLQTPQTYGKSINPSNAEVVADYISRADAIEAVHNACNYCDTCDLKGIGCSQINALSALPSAEAVQGEWGHMIADGTDGSHWYEYECSHCGEVVLRPYNFCPNCGADMRGEEE